MPKATALAKMMRISFTTLLSESTTVRNFSLHAEIETGGVPLEMPIRYIELRLSAQVSDALTISVSDVRHQQ